MIGKLFKALAEIRRTVTSPAGHVTLAGVLVGTGVRIMVSVLGDVVDELGIRRALQHGHAEAISGLQHRLAVVEHTMVAHNLNPPVEQLPEDVDGWPVGKRVEVPVSGIRVEEPQREVVDGREF
jgi:hypothetical protein